MSKGLVLRSKTCEEGGTFYTIILKRKLFFPWLHETARLYKNWKNSSGELEVFINKKDSINYKKEIKEGNLEILSEEEIKILKEDIQNLPKATMEEIYGKNYEIKLFPRISHDPSYNVGLEKISNLEILSKNLDYKKRLVI